MGKLAAQRVLGWSGGFAIAACATLALITPHSQSVSKIKMYEPADYFMEMVLITNEISDISSLVAQEEFIDALKI